MFEKWCLVTGGRGFAARHLVEMLIKYNVYSVRIADLGRNIKLESDERKGILGEALRSGRAHYISIDLRDKSQVLRACEGAEVVFHMAAPNSSINNYHLHHSVNVEGTKNVVDACIELKVKRLIYTSSPSVVFDGVHEIFSGNETLPYPRKYNDYYSATKAEAEALVLKSNGSNGLLTCCLRPSSIFGPGDKLLVPSLVEAAKAGKSKDSMRHRPYDSFFMLSILCPGLGELAPFIIGDGNNINDFTYVENVAHAHICAERALASQGAVADKASGEAYFITNMEPIKFWEFMSIIVEGLGYERPKIKIPAFIMMPIAHMVEWTYRLLGPYGMKVPQLTPSRIRLLSCSRSFDCSKAKDRIGYEPIVSLQEGLQQTIDSYPHLWAKKQLKPKRDDPSKATAYLGSGRVADTLLWKDKKQTVTTLLVLVALYYNFIVSGCTILTAISKLLLFALIFLFVNGILPEEILGYTVEKMPASWFYLSEDKLHQVVLSLASSWNFGISILKSIAQGNNCLLLLKVVLTLLILNFLGAFSLPNLCAIGLTLAFIACYAYEKEEQDVDAALTRTVSFGFKLRSGLLRRFHSSKY